MEISCWNCKHFERVRMWAYCHGGKKVCKLPQKAWYSGNIKSCTYFSPKDEEEVKADVNN